MELPILDPFGDYQTNGYLQNHFKEKDLAIVGHLETAAFESNLYKAIHVLTKQREVQYEQLCDTHRQLFDSLYPWAGQDRSLNAPGIAIVKAGYKTLFAHPADVRRAAAYALERAKNAVYLRQHPGEVFGYLAYAHPFLEGNGRTIMTVYAELCRRGDFHIVWEEIDKTVFLQALTDELLKADGSMDELLLPCVKPGALSVHRAAMHLRSKFNRL